MSADLKDAKLFAEEIIQGADRAIFYAHKLSSPQERYYNLAKAFLEVSSPICCHAEVQCDNCPMKHWEIRPGSWIAPLSGPRAHGQTLRGVGLGKKQVTLSGRTYPSIASAARELGVHKSVINRLLRDEYEKAKLEQAP